MSTNPLLEVEDLTVSFPGREGPSVAVRGVSFTLGRERLGIVGESGSGKSTTGRAILGLVPPPGRVEARRLAYAGRDLLSLRPAALRRLRGCNLSMIMQDPKYSLNPVLSVGRQVTEAYRLHHRVTRRQARDKALAMLEAVQIRDPERVYASYPHQLSGGMGQRVMIAAMLIAEPDVLIADEPTSALDVTVGNDVLRILDDLVTRRGMGLLLISHNLTTVASFCDRVLVMYAGRIVEACDARALHAARHPYTRGLLAAAPDLDHPVTELRVAPRDPAWLL